MNKKILIIICLIVCFMFVIPFYIFEGRQFIGGDDTRLYYTYPLFFIKNIAYYSWTNFASINILNPNQFFIPFLLLWNILRTIIKSDLIINYLAFSLPLVIGLISYIYFIKKFLHKKTIDGVVLVTSLLYVFSPITIQHQISVFLVTIWLWATLPLFCLLLIKYVQTSNIQYIYYSCILGIVFSIGFFATPWILGTVLVFGFGLVVYLFNNRNKFELVKKILLFCFFIVLSQAFWILPFIGSFLIKSESSFGASSFSKNVEDTFTPIVKSTAVGNIIYPLLNLPHRQLASNFDWELIKIFKNFYDKALFLSFPYILLFYFGLLYYKKVFNKSQKIKYLSIVTSYCIALFFYTVNIGPLKELFIFLKVIPGFSIFRNFYDKFALSVIFISPIILAYSLEIVINKYTKYRSIIILSIFLVIFINATPIKNIVSYPMWRTESVIKNTSLSSEYINFIQNINKYQKEESNILVLPLNIATYSLIPDDSNKTIYVGTSPTKIISDINTFTGFMSFNNKVSLSIKKFIKNKEYDKFLELLRAYNVNYIIFQKNIPTSVSKSYLFDAELDQFQEEKLILSISNNRLFESEKGNYELYSIASTSSLIESPQSKVFFKKISPILYIFTLDNPVKEITITFKDTYHPGWKVFTLPNYIINLEHNLINTINITNGFIYDLLTLPYFFIKSPYEAAHIPTNYYTNEWAIYPNKTNNYLLIFIPHALFYFGIFISGISLCVVYFLCRKNHF